MMPKVTAHFIRFVAGPMKWIANIMLFILFFSFFFFLLSGNSFLTFLNGSTLTLIVGAIAFMVLHVWLRDYADHLQRDDYTFSGVPTFSIPDIKGLPKKPKKKTTSTKRKPTSKVVQMSDYRR